ncbi:MAG: hypothetical protein SFV81_20960 [Pirellulaceae bacterium]|nr:hypothetical protein [Pirellulaceae bacterium]
MKLVVRPLSISRLVFVGWVALGCAVICVTISSTAWAQFDFEKPPINYGEAETHDRVAALAIAIEKGEVQFKYDAAHGWLPDVLKHLQVSEQSQVLVFSKTSLQLHKISPRTPRALYFNDDVYVGWCQQGDVVELAATDPELGAVFYTMDQQADAPPRIVRDRGQCLTCHATQRTQGVPGYLIRSVYPDINGRPRTGSRTYVTDHSSPFEQRWGGWYVTGSHGQMRHLGNVRSNDRTDPELMDVDAGANQQTLDKLINTDPYLTVHSDLVALLVLEHQSQMHNLISRASMEARTAAHYDRGINEALGRPIDTVSESTTRRINSAAEALVRYMLFADEAELANPICGTSKFAEQFTASAKLDQQGRSLRELDLQRHLLKYPCSYLIYSDAFDRMPQPVMDYVKRRMTEVLTADKAPAGYERLTDAQRAAIAEILRDTKPGFLL